MHVGPHRHKDNRYASGSYTEPEWRIVFLLSVGLDGAED